MFGLFEELFEPIEKIAYNQKLLVKTQKGLGGVQKGLCENQKGLCDIQKDMIDIQIAELKEEKKKQDTQMWAAKAASKMNLGGTLHIGSGRKRNRVLTVEDYEKLESEITLLKKRLEKIECQNI